MLIYSNQELLNTAASCLADPGRPNMIYALSWFLIFILLALWSLATWSMNAVAMWTISSTGTLTGAASGAAGLRLPEWLAPWVPSEIAQVMASGLSGLAPIVESLLQAAPSLDGGLTMAIWVIWALGSALLVLLGAGLHLVIAMWRRGGSAGPRSTQRVDA